MKHWLGSVSILAILASGSAFAADLPTIKGPVFVPPPPPVFSWTGVYIDGQIGAGVGTSGTSQYFDPFYDDSGSNNVGSTNPLYDTGYNGYGTSLTPVGTPPGYQSLTSSTYTDGASYGIEGYQNSYLNYPDLPGGAGRSLSPISYPNAPTALGDSRKLFGSAGVELGYDQQFNFLVVGVAADFHYLIGANNTESWNSSGSYGSSGAYSGGSGANCNYAYGCSSSGSAAANGVVESSLSWVGTVRGKIGLAFDRFEPYVTGGLAYGQTHMSSWANWADANTFCGIGYYNDDEGVTYPNGTCGDPGAAAGYTASEASLVVQSGTIASWSASQTQTRIGYALGVGANYAVTDHIFVKSEAIYYDLGTESLNVNGTGTAYGFAYSGGGVTGGTVPVGVSSYTVTHRFNGVIANVGVGYKFW
jgi:opacity protein-like surface antigen